MISIHLSSWDDDTLFISGLFIEAVLIRGWWHKEKLLDYKLL